MDTQQHDTMSRIDKMLQKMKVSEAEQNRKYLESLPPQFIRFLKQKQIETHQLTIPIPRYIRIKPNIKLLSQDIAESLKISQQMIVKVDTQFYALPSQVKISGSKFYQNGSIYGIDYSSVMPARCLHVDDHMQVLELCSAPGNKSMYIADRVQHVSIVAVEININRANVMKSLIQKYKLQHKIQVKVEDAVKFDSTTKFDRVLVDAECTHQGSIKHIKKFLPKKSQKNPQKNLIKENKRLTKQQQKQMQINSCNIYTSERKKCNEWTIQDFNQRFLDDKKLNNLPALQYGLLSNGFRLLKDDGVIVYSTCSFDEDQNQGIVQRLLDQCDNARVLDCMEEVECAVGWEQARIKGCARFKPSVSRCGGMFVAKIRKKPQQKKIEKEQKIQLIQPKN